MGCQDLLEDVPGRSRRDSTHSAPNDLKSFVKGKFNRIQPHCIGIRASGSNRTEPELIIKLKLKRCDRSELFQVVQRQGRDEQRDNGRHQIGQRDGGADQLEAVQPAGLGPAIQHRSRQIARSTSFPLDSHLTL